MSVTINGIGFVENSITLDTNYTLADNRNAMSAGPVTVADGITITVGNGSTWSVV
jgi:hypothetical protein